MESRGVIEGALVGHRSARMGRAEMWKRIRAHDWSVTPLGHVDSWPQRLSMAVDLMLDMSQPACIWWGADARLLYNDAYISILGNKHPDALGRTLSEVWPELADAVQHPLAAVQAGGPQQLVNREFLLQTGGKARIRRFTAAWTPLRDEMGDVIGTFHVVT